MVKGFKLLTQLGKGGMGEVWSAEQQIVNTKVAIKFLAPGVSAEAQVQRFFNEAIAVSKIHHAGIVKIFDVGFHGDRAYLIMELLEGELLSARIRRCAPLPLPLVAELGRQIVSVVEATRGAGVIHRDLKPDNVFLVADSELPGGERVKILDFGIAKLVTGVTGMTVANDSMGTPPYMAPEQWTDAGRVDARADTYSFGCVLFEMCCGRPPFVSTTLGEACTKHLHVIPPRARTLVAIPEELDELIARMLAKQPQDRPSISELRAAFERLVVMSKAGTAVSHEPPTTLGGAAMMLDRPRANRSRKLGVIAGLVVVALAGVGIYAATRSSDEPVVAAASPPTSPSIPPVLREPKLGLQAIASYADPTPATLANVRSTSLWTSARADFDEACKQPAASTRWCAAREFADGQLHHNDAKVALALAAFRRAAERDPTWAIPHIAIASSLTNANDMAGALEAAAKAQRLDPASWQAVAAAGRAYAAGHKSEDAIQEYQRARSLAPKNAVLIAELALTYHAGGMDSEAQRVGGEALALDDSLVNIRIMRAELALEKSDARTALAEADRALAVAPKNAAAHLARGDALALQYKKDEALREYERVLELRAGREIGLPEQRMALVEAAVAKRRLPPPRVLPTKDSRSRTNPAHPPTGGNRDRSNPTNCGDPLCM